MVNGKFVHPILFLMSGCLASFWNVLPIELVCQILWQTYQLLDIPEYEIRLTWCYEEKIIQTKKSDGSKHFIWLLLVCKQWLGIFSNINTIPSNIGILVETMWAMKVTKVPPIPGTVQNSFPLFFQKNNYLVNDKLMCILSKHEIIEIKKWHITFIKTYDIRKWRNLNIPSKKYISDYNYHDDIIKIYYLFDCDTKSAFFEMLKYFSQAIMFDYSREIMTQKDVTIYLEKILFYVMSNPIFLSKDINYLLKQYEIIRRSREGIRIYTIISKYLFALLRRGFSYSKVRCLYQKYLEEYLRINRNPEKIKNNPPYLRHIKNISHELYRKLMKNPKKLKIIKEELHRYYCILKKINRKNAETSIYMPDGRNRYYLMIQNKN